MFHTPPGIVVQGDFIPLNQLRIPVLDEIRGVFGGVLAGLGDIVAELLHDLQPHQIVLIPVIIRRLGPALDLGIQVVALQVLNPQQPRLMIDTRDLPPAVIHIFPHIQQVQQAAGAALNRMAQPHGPDGGVPLHIAAEHSHGIGVIEEQRPGAKPLHVLGVALHHGDGPQSPEDPAYAQGVRYGLSQAVLLGDLEIGDGAGLISSHLDGVDNKIRAGKRLSSVQSFDDIRLAVCGFVDVAQDLIGLIQPDGIDIEQTNVKGAQLRGQDAVPDDIAGENRAARADKGDFHSVQSFPRVDFILSQTGAGGHSGMLSPLDFMLHFSPVVICC